MNFLETFARLTDDVDKAFMKKLPEILAGTGIACFITSTIAAVAVTPKAVKEIEKKKDILQVEKLSPKETVKTTWRLYLPSVLGTIGGTGFIIGSVTESNSRYLAMSTSYQLLQDFAYTYRDKVVETLGARKEEKIRHDIAQDKLNQDTSLNNNSIVITNQGNTLFRDSLTGQYFRYDIDKFKRKAIEFANAELNEGYIGVPEWLSEFGLAIPDTMLGMGWSISDQGKVFTVDFTANIAVNYNDEPCLVINYYPMPISDYYVFYK